MSDGRDELLARARAAAATSYSPYSCFAVGAAVRWRDGGISTGANLENACYPLAVCAERHAVAAGVAAGWHEIAEAAVWADVDGVVTPCGACRQVLAEFAPDLAQVPIHLGGRAPAESTTLAALLPRPFRIDRFRGQTSDSGLPESDV